MHARVRSAEAFGGVYGFWEGLSSLSDSLDTLAQPVFGRPVCATLCANLGDQSYGSRFGEGGRSGEAISVGFTRFPRFFSLFSPPPRTPALIIRTLASPFLVENILFCSDRPCSTLRWPALRYLAPGRTIRPIMTPHLMICPIKILPMELGARDAPLTGFPYSPGHALRLGR